MVVFKLHSLLDGRLYVGHTAHPLQERARRLLIEPTALGVYVRERGLRNFSIEPLDWCLACATMADVVAVQERWRAQLGTGTAAHLDGGHASFTKAEHARARRAVRIRDPYCHRIGLRPALGLADVRAGWVQLPDPPALRNEGLFARPTVTRFTRGSS